MIFPPSLLLLGSQMETGGAQRVLMDQASWFYAQGWQVTVAFFYDKEGLHGSWQQQVDFPIINLFAKRPYSTKIGSLFALLGGVRRLFFLMRRQRFDAVETFTHHSNQIGLPLAWLTGIPIRIGSHHGRILGYSKLVERIHALVINLFATKLVAVSQRVGKEAIDEGINVKKLTVIPNGVQLPMLDERAISRTRAELGAGNQPLVLTAGRMTYQKAQTFLLQAAAILKDKYSEVIFIVVGDGPLRVELEAEARRYGMEGRIKFLGIRTDLPQLMAACDIFALSSQWEGLPLVLLEAMGMGCAVVATDVEGVGEVIRDGENGLLVTPEDPQALAAAIAELLNCPSVRQQMGKAAQITILNHYTVENMCRQYMALLCPQWINDAEGCRAQPHTHTSATPNLKE